MKIFLSDAYALPKAAVISKTGHSCKISAELTEHLFDEADALCTLVKKACFLSAHGSIALLLSNLLCREEGGIDGGIVIQDCFELVNNLLRSNPQNQLMFRCCTEVIRPVAHAQDERLASQSFADPCNPDNTRAPCLDAERGVPLDS